MTRGTVPVAIAHDYLTQRGGAERVVLALSRAFPEAPIYTTLYDPGGTFPDFADRENISFYTALGRLDDVDRRREVGLARPEPDHGLTGSLERLRLRAHGQRRRLRDGTHTCRDGGVAHDMPHVRCGRRPRD